MIERVQVAAKRVEQCRDFDIQDRRSVVLALDVAVQAIARQIEEQTLLREELIEACDEAQQHLIGIDDQQRTSVGESGKRRGQVVSAAHAPPRIWTAICTAFGSIRLVSQKSTRSSSFAMRKSKTATRKSITAARALSVVTSTPDCAMKVSSARGESARNPKALRAVVSASSGLKRPRIVKGALRVRP